MDITCRGDSWSASVKETNGMNLNFRSTYLDPGPRGSASRRSTTHSSLVGSSASGECNEPRRVAVRRWRRTARLKEPQEHGPFLGVTTTSFTAPVLSNSSSARPPRAANASLSPRTAIPLGIALFALAPELGQRFCPIHCPNPSPTLDPTRRENSLCPVYASLRLRFRSAAFCRRPPKEGFLRRDKFFARLRDSFYFGSPPK